MLFKRLALFSLFCLFLTGCASMFGDNTRSVSVSSDPEGAGIFIDNVRYGTTPATISLPDYIYGGKVVTLRKDNYVEVSQMVHSKFQFVGLWNILFSPGFLIDAATGNTVKIDPADLNMNIKLTPANDNKTSNQSKN